MLPVLRLRLDRWLSTGGVAVGVCGLANQLLGHEFFSELVGFFFLLRIRKHFFEKEKTNVVIVDKDPAIALCSF
ncbi:hypothetical protein PAHAL_5G127500 [Panicum hallii]|jgi:hypothetical protein|uniref:Uncharacterized protein n=1 Tax=Panicum hallii TaxID=206008 RepID=A0A2T8IJT7_9POAL|nr:hypothetical protein PAHAL_5G127500 [Panicum hallii]